MPFAESGGVRIHWRTSGSGDPLLLIMGLGYTSDMWHHVEAGLARRFRVIAFDNRGIGRSGAATPPHTISAMARDAAAVLDAAGVASSHVFGVSMGGFIAQELSLSFPVRVRALVLGCTACGGAHAVPAEREVLDMLVARAHMPAEEGIRAMIPYIYDANTSSRRIEADMAVRLASYPDPQTYLGQIDGVRQWRACERLDALALPTLILHGKNDRLVPPENAALLAQHIRGSEVLMLENAGHVFTTDRPRATIGAVSHFLSAGA